MFTRVAVLPAETVALEQALGRVLREEVVAARDQPPFDSSAMDGWAVRLADAEHAPARLAIIGESAAGRGYEGVFAPGEAVRISTGAPLPEGADWVVMQEEASRTGQEVCVGPLHGNSRFVRARGCDFAAGAVLLTAGTRLDPWRIALAAAAGRDMVRASARPRVVIVPTGDEVAPGGTSPGQWQIHDSVGAGLAAWFGARGCDVRRHNPLPDDRSAVTAALRDVDCDLLVTVGGASVGDHDVVKPALAAMGIEMVVDGVAVRPGKPTWFGLLPDGPCVLGLPGNPVSAMVCAELFGVGVLAALEGAPHRVPVMRARLGAPLPATGPREHYARAIVARDAERGFVVEAAADQDSSLLSVLAGAAGLIRRLPGAPAAATGEIVEFLLLDRAGVLR